MADIDKFCEDWVDDAFRYEPNRLRARAELQFMFEAERNDAARLLREIRRDLCTGTIRRRWGHEYRSGCGCWACKTYNRIVRVIGEEKMGTGIRT